MCDGPGYVPRGQGVYTVFLTERKTVRCTCTHSEYQTLSLLCERGLGARLEGGMQEFGVATVRSPAKRCQGASNTTWNSDVHVLTTAARLCPYLDHSYITATTATQVYNYYCSDCPIWSRTERSKFLFRTPPFSIVGHSLAPLCGTLGS